jgi:hypothetical protein
MLSKKIKRIDYFRSFWSLLSAIPYSDRDVHYTNVMGEREKYVSSDKIKYYSKTIHKDGQNIDVPWIETSQGVYVIINRSIPIYLNGTFRSVPAIAVLYSDKPQSMKSILSGDTTCSDDIDVLSIHQEAAHYINGVISYHNIIRDIKKDAAKLRDDIQTHETYIDEGNHL